MYNFPSSTLLTTDGAKGNIINCPIYVNEENENCYPFDYGIIVRELKCSV